MTIAKNYSFKEAKLEKKMLFLLPRVIFESNFFAHKTFHYVSLLYSTSSENVDS